MLQVDNKKAKMINNTMNGERGYTLIEVVLALLIISFMAAIAAPQITSSIQNMRLNLAAGKMLSDIRYARELALSRHATYGISVNAAGNSYNIFSYSGGIKTIITDPRTEKNMTVNLSSLPEYSGVTIGAVSLCQNGGCPSADMRFNSFGVPSDSNGTAMSSSGTIVLSAGGVTKTVTIYPTTAFSEAL